jgi:hypothetical protein
MLRICSGYLPILENKALAVAFLDREFSVEQEPATKLNNKISV